MPPDRPCSMRQPPRCRIRQLLVALSNLFSHRTTPSVRLMRVRQAQGVNVRIRFSALISLITLLVVPPCSGNCYGAWASSGLSHNDVLKIASIAPDDSTFSDLKGLDPVFASNRIILLGECDHGDGSTFLAKTRLIKYLHEKHHFDLLIFESELLGCYEAWQIICGKGDPTAGFKRGVFGVWANSQQLLPLVDYLKSQARGPNELVLAGMGTISSGSITAFDNAVRIEQFVSTLGSRGTNEVDTFL